ncbi:phosphate-starvation-inducible protein PsiE [Thioalkalivibrio paradoxus]|uniref:Protein PsiE n=1 Tax=Thioalkalivibrio paradoxus ARh 1 TaxID=713585 RepID=W0DJ40_9GAMM|nr:phosphate-starvation-inducible PsiE family protein [Thioalkalivibrio paradoxus]AHE98466.1 PsiE family protein [Thioalkalivibrio paradoxus ARh 1]
MSEKSFVLPKRVGLMMAEIFKLGLLFIAGFGILWATILEVTGFVMQGGPGLGDVLMLFLLIELAAMVAIYFRTNRLSVRFLVYIAITALTRVLVVDAKTMDNSTVLTLVGAIFLLTLGVLVLRGCEVWFGQDDEQKE